MTKIKFFGAITIALAASVFIAGAQTSGVTYFYSKELLNTNFSWSATVASGATTSAAATAGATNLVTANYPVSGPWVSTKGVTATDLNAVGETLQIQASVASATACLLTLTFAVALDDPSITKGAGLLGTNAVTFTTLLGAAGTLITVQVPLVGTAAIPQTFIYTIPASTFGGAKWFKLLSIANSVITLPVSITSIRAGYWY